MEQLGKYGIRAVVFSIVLFCRLFIQYVSGTSAVVTGQNLTLKDTTVKIIWREEIYDQGLKANVSVLKLNDSYFTGISDPEKAVIGYLASISKWSETMTFMVDGDKVSLLERTKKQD